MSGILREQEKLWEHDWQKWVFPQIFWVFPTFTIVSITMKKYYCTVYFLSKHIENKEKEITAFTLCNKMYRFACNITASAPSVGVSILLTHTFFDIHVSSAKNQPSPARRWECNRGRRGVTPYNGLYGEALPKRGTFFRLQVYKRVGNLNELCMYMNRLSQSPFPLD